jgi:hypothetical protein
VGRDAKSSRGDLGGVKTEIFLRTGLDIKIAGQPVGQISLAGWLEIHAGAAVVVIPFRCNPHRQPA